MMFITLLSRSNKCFWRVSIARGGAHRQKRFYHHAHGGASNALHAAQAWRDAQLLLLPKLNKLTICQRARRNNTSGRTGVYLRTQARRKNGKTIVVQVWQARSPEGIFPQSTKSFSVQKYGHHEAYRLACAARASFELSYCDLQNSDRSQGTVSDVIMPLHFVSEQLDAVHFASMTSTQEARCFPSP